MGLTRFGPNVGLRKQILLKKKINNKSEDVWMIWFFTFCIYLKDSITYIIIVKQSSQILR